MRIEEVSHVENLLVLVLTAVEASALNRDP